LTESRISTAELVDAALNFGNQGTIRRIGYLLATLSEQQVDRAGLIPVRLVGRLEKALRSSSSTVPWIPTIAKRGQVNQRWGLVVNGTIPSAT
jgi:predicted transcriptional regulator of viral defense system